MGRRMLQTIVPQQRLTGGLRQRSIGGHLLARGAL
jgi:hypothetical protein